MVAFLKKLEGSKGFHQIVDFFNSTHIKYALTENPTIYVSLIYRFWQTASASTFENREMEITATIDGRVKTITEVSIRRHLKLEDSDGISTLPSTKIFEQLALMGAKKTAWDQFSSNIATCWELKASEVTTVSFGKEKQDKRNEIKARETLLMALPNKDQLKFHSYKDAKLLMESIEKSNSSTNEADNTAYGVSTAHTKGNIVNSTYGDNLSDPVIYAFLASQPNSP
ncbi:hypothetical protein Tco_0353643 [Tanacetum coccineum]